MSEQITATLKFSTGMHSDAALISIESNSEQMVSDDIYDCGVYDWIAYNLEIEIPKCSILTIKVDVNASYWGDDIDEINYSIIGDVKIQDTRNHDRMADEVVELREMLKRHKEFNEHMHEMPPEWTLLQSMELHKETTELLNK